MELRRSKSETNLLCLYQWDGGNALSTDKNCEKWLGSSDSTLTPTLLAWEVKHSHVTSPSLCTVRTNFHIYTGVKTSEVHQALDHDVSDLVHTIILRVTIG